MSSLGLQLNAALQSVVCGKLQTQAGRVLLCKSDEHVFETCVAPCSTGFIQHKIGFAAAAAAAAAALYLCTSACASL